MKRALIDASVHDFLAKNCDQLADELMGKLVRLGFSGESRTLESYSETFLILQSSLSKIVANYPEAKEWWLFFEFQLPRRQKRIDLIILANDRIIVIEFKTGNTFLGREAIIQAEDYALDLRDFHKTSTNRLIVPVVVGNEKFTKSIEIEIVVDSPIAKVITIGAEFLHEAIQAIHHLPHHFQTNYMEPQSWQKGSYHPVPPILEAALHLYKSHNVADIASCSAGSENLTLTVDAIREIVTDAVNNRKRTICFVTGVPGSGKTLAGLSAVHMHSDEKGELPSATFLSGNIPLVNVLREALVRDAKENNKKVKSQAQREVRTFVESMQSFIAEYNEVDRFHPPINKVIVFDEAQRAWDLKRMSQKKKITKSEPQLLLEIMGRHEDAVIIALVGGGQEIHSGEAGLKGWGDALEMDHRWHIYASPDVIEGSNAVGGSKLFPDGIPKVTHLSKHSHLNLKVNRRSIKSQLWNEWVEAFLAFDFQLAKGIAKNIDGFEVRKSRNIEHSREWVRARSRGTRRCGLLSSSGNIRARAFGIEVTSGFKGGIDWASWFLNEESDVRSSSYLEVAATEFECQGLELDETVLCWGGDFLPNSKSLSWNHLKFRGSKWINVKRSEDQRFILSKYRVLLTRARTGMVIWIPPARKDDQTMRSEQFDFLYECLSKSGIEDI